MVLPGQNYKTCGADPVTLGFGGTEVDRDAPEAGPAWLDSEGVSVEPLRCAGAVIVDDDLRVFIQRRSKTRRLFPDTWDIVGGHLEPGETVEEALYREVSEETGWRVSIVLATIGDHSYVGEDGLTRVETDFLIRVDGDLSRPRLEVGKHTEFRWIGRDEIDVLDENRGVDGGAVKEIVRGGFTLLSQIGL